MSEESVRQAPQLPPGVTVIQPQDSEKLVLRTPKDAVEMDWERARDLGRLLIARTEDHDD